MLILELLVAHCMVLVCVSQKSIIH